MRRWPGRADPAAQKRPGEISGGMKQRVGIARALSMEPKVLLMDEPFGALDALTRAKLQDELLQIVQTTHSTVVMVTHDVDEAVLLSDRIVMMTNGPSATIGEVLAIELPRPRNRVELAESTAVPALPQGGDRLPLHAPGARGKSRLRATYPQPRNPATQHRDKPKETAMDMRVKEKQKAGDGRQRHGRRAHARRAAQDRSRHVRHHRLRRRAASQLQPHPAVAGAGRRTDAGRDRAQLLGLVHRQPHHAARRQKSGGSTASSASCAPRTAPKKPTTAC
jgi:ABC-type sulfate/molybdate transport systems ATPase subunit